MPAIREELEFDFEELISRANEEGELVEETEKITARVYEKIFLDLQQDEIELSHETFKKIFYKLIEFYQSEQDDLNLEKIMQTEDLGQNEIITDLIMKEEQHQLHEWEKRNVYVKTKGSEVVQLVSETILSMRRYLINHFLSDWPITFRACIMGSVIFCSLMSIPVGLPIFCSE